MKDSWEINSDCICEKHFMRRECPVHGIDFRKPIPREQPKQELDKELLENDPALD
jgi:hypothetical protein